MGRPKKIRATVTAAAGSTMTMERPKTVTVSVVRCPHCSSPESKSECYGNDKRHVAEFGFRLDYMRCKSETCLANTDGEGRPWKKRNYNF